MTFSACSYSSFCWALRQSTIAGTLRKTTETWRIISATLQEAGYGERSETVRVERGFCRSRVSKVPCQYSTTLDKNARNSRKRIEPEIVAGLRSFRTLQKDRPRARVAIRNAQRELRGVLDRWEMAYEKENFYRGIRVLLELQRNGVSKL